MSILSIDSGYFFASLIYKDKLVIEAAPIIKYMRGWTIDKVREYCNKKSWKIIK